MNAGIILEIIIIAIAALTLISAVKRGFVKTLLSALSFFMAVIIALSFTAPLKQAILKSPLSEKIENAVKESINNYLSNDLNNADSLFPETNNDDDIAAVLDKFGIDKKKLEAQFDEWKEEGISNLKEKVIEYVAKPATDAAATVISFLILYLVARILIVILTYVLDLAMKLPVLSTINKLLSYPLGIVLALLRIYAFCAVVGMLMPYAKGLGFKLLSYADMQSTVIFKWFYTNNLLIDFLK